MHDVFTDDPSRSELVTAALVGVVGVAGSYATTGSDPTFVVVPVHSLVVDLMPAPVLTFSILVLGEVGDLLGFLLALSITVTTLGVVTVVGLAVGRRRGTAASLGVVYFGSWTVTVLLTWAPWSALGVAVPMTVVTWLTALRPLDRVVAVNESRRLVLRLVGTAGVTALAYTLGRRMPFRRPPRLTVIPSAEQAEIKRRLRSAHDASLDVAGVTGLVSPVDEFYEVDVDTIDPAVDANEWTLTISGTVETERSLSYDDLTSRSPEHRFSTLRCVGESLNGHLMDNALWTGVPIDDLLAGAGVTDAATHVRLRAVDDYYETFPLSAVRGGLLAYGMNGYLLPRAHGYPLRALVPGHWGEVNVKWLTEIEVLDGRAESYWEKRGWHGTGPVNTVAKLHARNRLDDGRVQLGGHAYAGTRNIREVQVSVDGGESWATGTLSPRLSDTDVWRQWRYTYRPPDHEHTVVVRAVDGTGEVQPRTQRRAFPNGASGWVSTTIRP